MKRYPVIFSIAGSDSTGGAGIQADIKTISALGAYAASALTSIMVQNTVGIDNILIVPEDIIRRQIELIMEDMWPDVVKIGLVNSLSTAHVIADCLRKYHPEYVVYDPVLEPVEGFNLFDKETFKAACDELFPYTNLITLNIPEIETITDIQVHSKEDLKEATKKVAEKYLIPVLGKGYNLLDNNTYDVLYVPDGDKWEYIGSYIDSPNTHGASTSFSAAIATYLALGEKLNEAIRLAREYIQKAIDTGKDVYVGRGKGPICHTWNPVKMQIYGKL